MAFGIENFRFVWRNLNWAKLLLIWISIHRDLLQSPRTAEDLYCASSFNFNLWLGQRRFLFEKHLTRKVFHFEVLKITPHGLVCRQTLLLMVCPFNSTPQRDTNYNPSPKFFKMTWAQTLTPRLKARLNRTLCIIYENWGGIQLHTFLDTSVKFACSCKLY